MTKLAGDVSVEHRELAEQLTLFEETTDLDKYADEMRAKVYVCLAHDWYCMGAEEEGNRLLLKADKTFPGYFQSSVIKHQLEDEVFDRVIKNITLELARMLVDGIASKM